MRLVTVDAPHFCASMVFEGLIVIDAAPILNWTIGKHANELALYFKCKGWKTEVGNGGPRVLNKHHALVLPPNTVYCGRGSPNGNPFVIGRDGDRDEVCDKFEREVLSTLDVSSLRGKNLLCFCAPKRCHCDAILIKANAVQGS